ncbi:hypothetical protein WJX72_005991 [[Myrmecia] bisecta]|uniref:Uncharacterized protein n=1 Tax=[Myrmecia] bisecta TaxID=41462 RepID=A0AAW1P2D0_9CHLO
MDGAAPLFLYLSMLEGWTVQKVARALDDNYLNRDADQHYNSNAVLERDVREFLESGACQQLRGTMAVECAVVENYNAFAAGFR